MRRTAEWANAAMVAGATAYAPTMWMRIIGVAMLVFVTPHCLGCPCTSEKP